jgi:hypothetical protein
MRITQSSCGLLVVGNSTLSEFHLLGLDDTTWADISLVLGRLLILSERSAMATGALACGRHLCIQMSRLADSVIGNELIQTAGEIVFT